MIPRKEEDVVDWKGGGKLGGMWSEQSGGEKGVPSPSVQRGRSVEQQSPGFSLRAEHS